MLGSLLCPHGSSSVLLDPYGSTISETTSEAWSVEVLPSDSGTNIRLLPRFVAAPPSPRMRFIRVYGSLAQTAVGCGGGGDGTPHLLVAHSKPGKERGEEEKRKRKEENGVRAAVMVFSLHVPVFQRGCALCRRKTAQGSLGGTTRCVCTCGGAACGRGLAGGRRGSSCLQSVLSH